MPSRDRNLWMQGCHRAAHPRKVKGESRACAHITRNDDVAAVLLNDLLDDRQPQACPLPWLLGREEGLEQARESRLVHSTAGIAHRETNVRPVGDDAVRVNEFLLQ